MWETVTDAIEARQGGKGKRKDGKGCKMRWQRGEHGAGKRNEK